MRAPRRAIFAIQLALLTVVGCDRSTSPSSPGTVATTLLSPFSDDGAALIEFTGDVTDVTASAGTTAFLEKRSGGVVRVLLVRETPGTIQFALQLPNRSRRPTARVLEVSDAADLPRADVSAYRVEY